MLLEVDGRCAIVEGLVGVSVGHKRREEGMVLDALPQGCEVGTGACNIEAVLKLVDGADNDVVVESKVLSADGPLLVRAWPRLE